ncbi:phospholipase effector Tle1 domain-containing protein [Sulfitobacter sp.]|uniref:phospholipase effector Tle1 domain-containing protein n=1 Tax=Sulfitobacter sp. TaxID=1903071 RepID=UPI00356144B8
MAKNILIFSDGTGQVGGLHPDQRLSNIYKMYRAMRPGPSSPIRPEEQVCYYDPGLGAGEVGGLTLKRIRNTLSAAVGTGIDENVIDCYEKIISYYEPGDRILLFGFSRGAYTVRAVTNVMNLCGVPTQMPDGSAVPLHGPRLRKIASDAVNFVYNHGNGFPRGLQPYYERREELGRRFRKKYRSFVPGAQEDVQGNVQPTFVGVFDTVAALGSAIVGVITAVVVAVLLTATIVMMMLDLPWYAWIWSAIPLVPVSYWYGRLRWSQWKYFSPNENRPLRISRIRDWPEIWKYGHRAMWNRQNYDRWLDSDVQFARHALSIDEHRRDFPRVKWAMPAEAKKTEGRDPVWLKQVWFAGCHSDVGGSYLEPESRLSDIALEWMLDELRECVPEIQVNADMLYLSPDHKGMQHEETFMFKIGPVKRKWPTAPRMVDPVFQLHPTVIERLMAGPVSHLGEMRVYRPVQLKEHPDAAHFYD